jgi:tRNA modification GTPase
MTDADTIFAPATAPGRAAIAVVRLSGPHARAAVAALAGPLPRHGRTLRILRDARGEPLDEALVLTWEAGRSFTGEEAAEIQCHGSPAVLAALARALGAQGARLAAPGEFSRRALANGRLDLAQVEGLADLLAAETEAQRAQALRLARGALGARAAEWRIRMTRALALAEAAIDFAEEDLSDLWPEVAALAAGLETELRAEAAGARAAERLRDGFEVALVGRPNAGKSTLLNRLAGRDAALVSPVPGTTRDVLELRLELDGLPLTILDMAGLRDSGDPIEALGVERARARAAQADLRLHLLLPGDPPPPEGADDMAIAAQADRGPLLAAGLPVSGLTGAGVDALLAEIAHRLRARVPVAAAATRTRHALALGEAADRLAEARTLVAEDDAPELVAEALRRALRALDTLVGRVGVEDILDEIFSSFCIGK